MALDGGRLGAETDVERDGPGTAVPGGRWNNGGGNGGGGRLPPMPMSGGGGDSDEDAEMGDVQFEEAAEVRSSLN